MRNLFLLFVLMLLSVGEASADTSTTMVRMGNSDDVALSSIIEKGLPVLYVMTVNQEEPTCEYVSAPSGSMGRTIRNATKVPGRLTMYQRLDGIDSVVYDSGDYESDVSGMTIRIRGNTSAYADKKPYKIKLQKKKDLLLRGNENKFKDKDWLLIKDHYLFVTAGYIVSELLNMPWTPGHRFVNVVLNDEYRGVYLLCESVKRNPDCRINVDKNTGYIFECDPYWWNEDVYAMSTTSPAYNFTFKYPDSEDLLPEQMTYFQGMVSDYENSLNSTDYPDKIDVVSFATWCLAHDMMGTQDSGGANRFYYKYDDTDTTRIVMPVLWDFDMVERTTSQWSRCHVSHFDKLFNNTNPQFVDEFVWQWRRVSTSFYPDFIAAMNAFSNSDEYQGLRASEPLELQRWNFNLVVDTCVYDRKYWYQRRVAWINPVIDALNPVGDINFDGKVQINDVTSLIDWLLGSDSPALHAYDVNGNGTITITDVTALIDILLSGN